MNDLGKIAAQMNDVNGRLNRFSLEDGNVPIGEKLHILHRESMCGSEANEGFPLPNPHPPLHCIPERMQMPPEPIPIYQGMQQAICGGLQLQRDVHLLQLAYAEANKQKCEIHSQLCDAREEIMCLQENSRGMESALEIERKEMMKGMMRDLQSFHKMKTRIQTLEEERVKMQQVINKDEVVMKEIGRLSRELKTAVAKVKELKQVAVELEKAQKKCAVMESRQDTERLKQQARIEHLEHLLVDEGKENMRVHRELRQKHGVEMSKMQQVYAILQRSAEYSEKQMVHSETDQQDRSRQMSRDLSGENTRSVLGTPTQTTGAEASANKSSHDL